MGAGRNRGRPRPAEVDSPSIDGWDSQRHRLTSTLSTKIVAHAAARLAGTARSTRSRTSPSTRPSVGEVPIDLCPAPVEGDRGPTALIEGDIGADRGAGGDVSCPVSRRALPRPGLVLPEGRRAPISAVTTARTASSSPDCSAVRTHSAVTNSPSCSRREWSRRARGRW
jgi:hypothetical protein